MNDELSVIGREVLGECANLVDVFIRSKGGTSSSECAGVLAIAYTGFQAAMLDTDLGPIGNMGCCKVAMQLCAAAMFTAIVMGGAAVQGVVGNPSSAIAKIAEAMQAKFDQIKASQAN